MENKEKATQSLRMEMAEWVFKEAFEMGRADDETSNSTYPDADSAWQYWLSQPYGG